LPKISRVTQNKKHTSRRKKAGKQGSGYAVKNFNCAGIFVTLHSKKPKQERCGQGVRGDKKKKLAVKRILRGNSTQRHKVSLREGFSHKSPFKQDLGRRGGLRMLGHKKKNAGKRQCDERRRGSLEGLKSLEKPGTVRHLTCKRL